MENMRALRATAVSLFFVLHGAAATAAILPGTPTTTVPSALFDPLCPLSCTLSSPLPGTQFLLPIEITGAIGLQSWSFDLLFDNTVVNPADDFGLYQSVYQAEFSVADPTLSNITSSGLPLAGDLLGIAGFSSGVSGNGLLAFVLFDFVPGQEARDPGFHIDNPTVQQVPEPTALALLAPCLMLLALRRMHIIKA
jgi:hypothetical protein